KEEECDAWKGCCRRGVGYECDRHSGRRELFGQRSAFEQRTALGGDYAETDCASLALEQRRQHVRAARMSENNRAVGDEIRRVLRDLQRRRFGSRKKVGGSLQS